jgi:hypothetical protein
MHHVKTERVLSLSNIVDFSILSLCPTYQFTLLPRTVSSFLSFLSRLNSSYVLDQFSLLRALVTEDPNLVNALDVVNILRQTTYKDKLIKSPRTVGRAYSTSLGCILWFT